jgi:hypothetical protein
MEQMNRLAMVSATAFRKELKKAWTGLAMERICLMFPIRKVPGYILPATTSILLLVLAETM